MADKYFTGYYSGDTYHRIYLELHVYTTATDLSHLKTTERADLYMVVNDASSQWWNGYGSEAYVSVNSNAKTANVTFDARTTGAKWLIQSWDTEVTHNSDGTKQISVSAHHYSDVGLGNASISGTYDCDTLTVEPTFTTNPSVTYKTETAITVDRGATNINSNFYWSLNNSTWTKFTGTTATITGLSASTSYTIYVQARNANNESYKTTKTLSVTTRALPTQSLSSKTENRITMNWSLDSVALYVWYSIDNGANWVAVGNVYSASGSYTITGLNPNTTYNIRTKLKRNATQTTSYSSNLAVKTYAAPTQSLNSKTETSIKMNWNVDSTADYIWYSIDNGTNWVAVGSVNATSGNYNITGLSANTTYNIKTRVRRSSTQTTYDTTALSVKTYAQPTQSFASKTETTVSLNWSIDSEANHLYYSTDNGANWEDAGAISGTSGTYTITGLDENTFYTLRLKLHRVSTDSDVITSTPSTITTYGFPYCTESPDFTISNEGVTLKFYNPLNRTFTFNIIGNGTQLAYAWTQSGGTSHLIFDSLETQNQLYATIPNQQSGTYQVKVTYGTSVKTSNFGNTFQIRGDEKPTFTDFEYEDADSRTSTLTGDNQVIVNLWSNPKLIVSTSNKAVGNKSASIVKYRFTVGTISREKAYSSSAEVSEEFNNITAKNLSVTAIDSRGLETTVTKILDSSHYIEYQNSKFTKVEIERENGVGTTVLFNLIGTYWNGNFGEVSNVAGVYYRYKAVGGTFSNNIQISNKFTIADGNITSSSGAFLPTDNTGVTPTTFTVGTEYIIEFLLTDQVAGQAWQTIQVELGSGIPCTDKVKNSSGTYNVGINQLADADYALAITGGLQVDNEKVVPTFKYHNSATGSSSITLPTNYTELLAILIVDSNSNICFSNYIPKAELTTTRGYNGGYYGGASTNCRYRITVSSTTASINAVSLNGTSVINNSVLKIYYK